MDSRSGPSPWAVVGGTVLLVIGFAFLLANAGLIRIDMSLLWPAVVIAVGVALIVGALRYRGADGPGDTSVAFPADDAARLELTLRVGAGRYQLAGGAEQLVAVTASGPTIAHRVERAGDAARVRLSTAVDGWNWGRIASGTDWRIGVSSGVPCALDVQAGAGGFDVDLAAVAVTTARFAIGAADLRVVLPRPRGEVPIRVEGGAASFTFEIPAGVEARVSASGLVSMSGPGQTPRWATSADRVTVTVTGGAAAVRVIQRP